MRIIDVVSSHSEMFDMAFVTDLCDNHVNDCLRVAQTVALESTPPLPQQIFMETSLGKICIISFRQDICKFIFIVPVCGHLRQFRAHFQDPSGDRRHLLFKRRFIFQQDDEIGKHG